MKALKLYSVLVIALIACLVIVSCNKSDTVSNEVSITGNWVVDSFVIKSYSKGVLINTDVNKDIDEKIVLKADGNFETYDNGALTMSGKYEYSGLNLKMSNDEQTEDFKVETLSENKLVLSNINTDPQYIFFEGADKEENFAYATKK